MCEPVGRNTAPCIGLGAVHVSKKYDDVVMIVLPSDHLIKNNEIFVKRLMKPAIWQKKEIISCSGNYSDLS